MNSYAQKPIVVKAITPSIQCKNDLWKAYTLKEITELMVPNLLQKIKVSRTDWIMEFKNKETIAGIFS